MFVEMLICIQTGTKVELHRLPVAIEMQSPLGQGSSQAQRASQPSPLTALPSSQLSSTMQSEFVVHALPS
jgi:hypothetical protein